jgi:sugar lactone lactonase YvrE
MTAHEHLTPEMRRMQPLAGGLFAVDQSGIRGLPEVRFAGIF